MNIKTPIQAVIFDFDGTLADTRSSIIQCFWEVLNHFHLTIPPNFSMEALFTQTLEERLLTIPGIDQKMIPDAIDQYNRRYTEIARKKAKLFPGVAKALATLNYSSIALAIATNESRKNLDLLMAALCIESFFSFSICHDEVDVPKPAPDMAHRILSEFDVPSRQTLIVGDSVLDLEMGSVSGCQTCAVTYGAQSAHTLNTRSPGWMVSSFSDILNIVEPKRKVRDPRPGKKIVTFSHALGVS